MEFGDKEFSYYWEIIKIPVGLLVAWSVIALITAKFSMSLYQTIFGTFPSLIIQIAILGFVGFHVVAEHKGKTNHSAWAGALTGAIYGFAGAILGILAIYLVPEVIDYALQQAVASGAPADMARTMISVGMYVNLVTGPLITGLIGALVGWIGGLIGKKYS